MRWGITGLAGLLVLFALNAPNEIDRLGLLTFLRIPIEGLAGVALLLVLPARARRAAAVAIGMVLAMSTIMKFVDMGFYAVLDRPFDLVVDQRLLDAGWTFVIQSYGQLGGLIVVLGVTLLGIALLALLPLSVIRLTEPLVRHRRRALRGTAVLAVVSVGLAVLGVRIIPDLPVSELAYDHLREAQESLRDRREFAAAIAADAFRDTPGDQLLNGLRGKDVVITFVESYGRDAVVDPQFAAIAQLLDAGNERLAAAGFSARSGFLTSPTSGGASHLAHATLVSGVWIDDQQRYDILLRSDRLTLGSAFRRADWRTAGVMPGIRWEWPQGTSFFGYETIYGVRDLGYQGPKFRWAAMPDQYTLSVFERAERARPGPEPVMAEVGLVSSHIPWTAVPRLIDWDDLGDGSVFHTPEAAGEAQEGIWSDPARVRVAYQHAVEYSLETLISYVETYGDRELVLIFMGDHQPGRIITGAGAGRDVPVTIVTADQAVLDRIAGWGWHDGLRPGPQAPVWPMDAFRDRFLTTFGPAAAPAATPAPSPD